MRGARRERHDGTAVNPVVQRHRKNAREAEREGTGAGKRALPQRGNGGAGKKHARRRRDVRAHRKR